MKSDSLVSPGLEVDMESDVKAYALSNQDEETAEQHAPPQTSSSPGRDTEHNASDTPTTPTTLLSPQPPHSPTHPTTLAARRHHDPPENLATALSPSELKAIATAKSTAEESARRRREQAERTPTPTTADFRLMLGTYVDDVEEVERLVEMRERLAEGKMRTARNGGSGSGLEEGKSGVESVKTAALVKAASGARLAKWPSLVELRVKHRLFPAMVMLSRPGMLVPSDVETAAKNARSALKLAQDEVVAEALQARCAYYVGLAEYLLVTKDPRGMPLPNSILDEDDTTPKSTTSRDEKSIPSLESFKRACAAKGVYDEGVWAEEWLQYLKDLQNTADEASPLAEDSKTGSWVKGLWRNFWPRSKGQSGRDDKQDSKSPPSDATDETYERIPSFKSIRSDETSRPTSKDSTTPATSPTSSTEITTTSPPGATEKSSLPLPVTSPTHSPTKSISFTSTSTSPNGNTSPQKSIYDRRHSRRPSYLAKLVSRRERRRSELEQTEEGNSPFRATFESVLEENNGKEVVEKGVGNEEVDGMV